MNHKIERYEQIIVNREKDENRVNTRFRIFNANAITRLKLESLCSESNTSGSGLLFFMY